MLRAPIGLFGCRAFHPRVISLPNLSLYRKMSNSVPSAGNGAATAPAQPQAVSTTQQERTERPKKEPKPKKQKEDALVGQMAQLELSPQPAYFKHRMDMFDRLKKEYDEWVAQQPREKISVSLPDGNSKEATAWETSPLDIAKGISKSFSEKVVIAKVDGQLWDLERPLEKSCSLELLDFDNEEGKRVFWHSSAHVLGEATERHYGCHLCLGPPTDEGFFYEMELPEAKAVLSGDYPALNKLADKITKEKQSFERLVVKKEDLLEMFNYNKFKQYLINSKIPDGSSTTVYRCGPMIDLCVGPHIPHTGKIKAITVLKNSASYFLGDSSKESLQRIYGISFPDNKQMTEYKKFLEEAASRDHRKIGREQELYFFNELSPGSCFWLPHGTRIYNTLVDMIKSEYRKRGFSEVISPNMYNSKLWKISQHWQHYQEDMFTFKVEKEEFALKPMNCPGHCLIYGSRERSYRELPIRLADFGVLHRNEASGALTGLTRVRRFQQDDAHIFCTVDQIESEITSALGFLKDVYGLFGFEFKMALSTRPEGRMGGDDLWDKAEQYLSNALEAFVPGQWKINPGDGAFYGPKIDITLTDATRRERQCATIQLDFNLPERFELGYRTSDTGADDVAVNRKRPVMIHRAILGSVERFVAMLAEHFAGKWPFWLSPRQVVVVPVAAPFKDYAQEVANKLWDAGLWAEADLSDLTLNKRIRNAEIAQYNFILVVGAEEQESRSVNVRNRDDVGIKGKTETIGLDDVLSRMLALKSERRVDNKL